MDELKMDELANLIIGENPNAAVDNDSELLRPPPDITDLETVLKTKENREEKDFIFRKGTTSDVFSEAKDGQLSSGKQLKSNFLVLGIVKYTYMLAYNMYYVI